MPKLSSALVQRHIASLRDVEEALARQVLYGGDLVTNLLEQARGIDEGALSDLLAESLGMPAAPSGELPRPAPEVLSLIPGDVALRYCIYPLAREGSTLSVAVSDALSEQVEQDLAFALGVELSPRASSFVRVRQAISRDYGVPLDRRSLRAIARLEGRPDPSPSVVPPSLRAAPDMSTLPRPPSIPPIGLPGATEFVPLYSGAPEAPRRAPAEPPPPATVAASPAAPAEPERPPSVHEAETAKAPPVIETGAEAEPEEASGEAVEVFSQAEPAESASPPPPSVSVSAQPPGLAAWSEAQRQAAAPPRARRRGPYTAADAEQDLLAAEDRDAVLSAFFDFAAQYFDYAVLFAVHGDLAEGREAHGPGASRAEVAGIGVPLDLPSSLSEVRDKKRFSLAPFSSEGLDAQLAADLRRPVGRKALLLPVTVRNRCVLIFYGDEGDADVELSHIGDVIAFVPLVESALESVIRKRKLATRSSLGPAFVPPVSMRASLAARLPAPEERAEALVRALESPPKKGPPPKPERSAPSSLAAPMSGPPSPLKPPPKPVSGTAATERMKAPSVLPVPSIGNGSPKKTADDGGGIHSKPTPPQGTPAQQRLSAADATPIPVFALTRRSPIPSAPTGGGSPARPSWEIAAAALRDQASPEPDSPADSMDDAPEIALGTEEIELPSEDEEEDDELPRSRSVVVAPRAPHKRHSSQEVRLPTVIIDVEADCKQLVQDLLGGDEGAIDKLKRLGMPGVSALAARFPGPVREELGRTRTRPSELGPILKALVRIGRQSVPFIVVRSNDGDPRVRAWATRVLGELSGEDAGNAVARRITDSDAEVRRAARDAGKWLQADAPARRALREASFTLVENAGQAPGARAFALEAIADFRDPLSVPRLIPLVADPTELGKSAQWALGVLTRQEFGPDVIAWEGWWRKHADRHRIEWLIDALMHEDQDVRREAGEELKSLTKEYFGYYDDLPKSDRALAQKRYRDWWEATGKARFSS